MKKIISLALLLNLCFAIDGIAKEIGFTDGSHEEVLNPVSIDSKVSIEIHNQRETFWCDSLQIQKDAELEFTKSSAIRATNVTIEAAKDIVINGKLTVEKGISLTLISKSFLAEHANITSSVFSVKSEEISIVASEIFSIILDLGSTDKTKIILFDQASKITKTACVRFDRGISFNAFNIYAHGDIRGKYNPFSSTNFNVGNFINIDNLNVDLEARDERYCGLSINFKDVECNLEANTQGGAASDQIYSYSSFLANIERLLGSSTHIYIKSNKKIAINSKLTSAPSLSYSGTLLRLEAPLIEINADVQVSNLYIYGNSSDLLSNLYIYGNSSDLCGDHGTAFIRASISVKELRLWYLDCIGVLNIPNTEYLNINSANIYLNSFAKLKKIYNEQSEIKCATIPDGFSLNELYLGYVESPGPLYSYAKKLVISNEIEHCCEIYLHLHNVSELDISGCFKTVILSFGKLNKLTISDANVKCKKELPEGLEVDIDSYKISGHFSTDDKLYKFAKYLHIENVIMDSGTSIDLTNVESMSVEKSSNINITAYGNLKKITRTSDSVIKCVGEVPKGFRLPKYMILGVNNINFTEAIKDPLVYLADDLVFEYKIKPSDKIEFPEFKKPLMGALTFKNCNLDFKKIVAKNITFEDSNISGYYVALINLNAKKTEFTLNDDNIFPETSIDLDYSKMSLTSNITLPKIKAVNCDIDLKGFIMKVKPIVSTEAAAQLPIYINPFEGCSIIGPGKWTVFKRDWRYDSCSLSKRA